jgi:protein-tyrosine phosphatase
VPNIYWIHPIKGITRPTLALVQRPRAGRQLPSDLEELRAAGIKILVSLLPDGEARFLGIADEEKMARKAGLEFISFPLPDRQIPPEIPAFRDFVVALATRVFEHEAVGIHCQASIGRSTLVAACTLIHLGWTPAHSLVDITNARGCPVPDTEEQQRWILRYKPDQ